MNTYLQTVAAVCRRLKVQPYLVGGTIRDQLVGRLAAERPASLAGHMAGRESHDWDIVCLKAKQVSQAAARSLSAKLITLDEQHKIYRVILPEKSTLDFAEQQGKTIQDDLGRRDFSINAMAIPLRNIREEKGRKGNRREKKSPSILFPDFPLSSLPFPVIDPFNGQKDLKKRVVRALSRKAFVEDPLRLLRAYRMAAQFDLVIEPQTRRWIAAEHRRLEAGRPWRASPSAGGVARERVREEFLRLLNQSKASPALAAMDQSGLLTTIFPELEAGRRVGKAYYGAGGVMKHHLQSVANVEWLLSRIETEKRGDGEMEKQNHRFPGSPFLRFISRGEIMQKIRDYVRQPLGGCTRAAFLKLGALLHDIGKPATAQVIKGRLRFFGHEEVGAQMVGGLLGALRFSRLETGLVRGWVRNHMRPGNLASVPKMTEKAMARFFRDMGEDGVGMLIVSLGDHYTYLARSKWGKGTDPVERTAGRLLEAYYLRRESVLPPRIIDGHQIMKGLRVKPGPLVGKLLDAVRDAQAEGKVKTLKDALAYAKKALTSKAVRA